MESIQKVLSLNSTYLECLLNSFQASKIVSYSLTSSLYFSTNQLATVSIFLFKSSIVSEVYKILYLDGVGVIPESKSNLKAIGMSIRFKPNLFQSIS